MVINKKLIHYFLEQQDNNKHNLIVDVQVLYNIENFLILIVKKSKQTILLNLVISRRKYFGKIQVNIYLLYNIVLILTALILFRYRYHSVL